MTDTLPKSDDLDLAKMIVGPGWPVTFNADGMVSVHNCDFIEDRQFKNAYRAALATPHPYGPDLHIEWRVYVCCWAAQQAKQLNADYAECGVFTGLFSSAAMKYIEFERMTDRKFYLLDTFDGIPVSQLTEDEIKLGIDQHNRFYFDCYDAALKTFGPYPNAIIIRGMVQDTISQVTSDRIGYLSIDMNAVVPEMVAADYFWPRLVDGAIIILDDYGWAPHILQKKAWDAFADSKGTKVLSLPTGQGLIVKHLPRRRGLLRYLGL